MINYNEQLTLSRRHFLRSAGLLSSALLFSSSVFSRNTIFGPDLPNQPVTIDHFPSRIHAFIWRNWQLVPSKKMAEIIGASTTEIEKLASAMGLEKQALISADQWSRSYITIIRRNWHLLPKFQLEKLLGWTAEQLEFTLQEDDFLYVKLGNVKPESEALSWSSTNSTHNEKWIKDIVHKDFDSLTIPIKEPLFNFVKELSTFTASRPNESTSNSFSQRFGYGYFTLFGDPLLDTDLDPYPDGYLDHIASAGLNGTWMHIVLSKITPFPWDETVSKDWQKRLKNLAKLVKKCKKKGVGIYLYLNEPRYQPLAFFDKYPELKGVEHGAYAALCTSHPAVQDYLEGSIAHIVSEVPDLAGFFSITASENRTHCWSHHDGDKCPRCASKSIEEVIASLHHLYESGIQKGLAIYRQKDPNRAMATRPSLIVWDWAWPDGWAEKIIPKLPKNVAYMCVSEWSLPTDRGGIHGNVGEYSISSIGPGARAKKHWAIARENGLQIFAKIQAGTTWECGGVPYIPALENVAQHIVNLRDEKVNGLMTGWTLGGYPGSPNLEIVSVIGNNPNISVRNAMLKVANNRYGKAAKPMVEAWYGFSKAFREFPYHIGVVYNAPFHSGPANLVWKEPSGYTATMVGIGYDDLKSWRSIYPENIFINQLYQVADGFDKTLNQLEKDCRNLSLTDQQIFAFQGEMRIAEAVATLYRSVANQALFIHYRNNFKSSTDQSTLRLELKRLLLDEIRLARRLFELQSIDSRIGYEASNHYFYVQNDLMEKVLNCRYLLENWVENI